jgi:PAS domain-containing protein
MLLGINNQARGTSSTRRKDSVREANWSRFCKNQVLTKPQASTDAREKSMTNATYAESIVTNSRLAVTLVRPDGEILYMSPVARELLDWARMGQTSLQSFLTAPTVWEQIAGRAERGETIKDEYILLETIHGDADLCYLTVLPQRGADGHVQSLLCVWAARQNALAAFNGGESLGDYTKELEELLEHRTYQHLLAAEQNEFAQQVLSLLSAGLIILSREGEVLYRNASMCDDFGLRPAEYLQPNIRHFMSSEIVESFHEVLETGARAHHLTADPGGCSALVDLLPVVRAGAVQRVVLQFTRPWGERGSRP